MYYAFLTPYKRTNVKLGVIPIHVTMYKLQKYTLTIL
uniref:Uncharacterized protein n=1 Tax=Anguilla anguilla TaxID=7936 RepID=A0A0E9QKV4_ANGAN